MDLPCKNHIYKVGGLVAVKKIIVVERESARVCGQPKRVRTLGNWDIHFFLEHWDIHLIIAENVGRLR